MVFTDFILKVIIRAYNNKSSKCYLEHVQLNTISKYAMLRNCVFYVSK